MFEAGDGVGASVRAWAHVRVFSPWEYDIDPTAAELLDRSRAGRRPRPTAIRPAVTSSSATSSRWPRCRRIAERLHLNARVIARDPPRRRQAQGRRTRRRRRSSCASSATASRSATSRGRSSMRRAPGRARIRSAPAVCRPSASARVADRIAYGIPDVLGADRDRYAGPSRARGRQRALRPQCHPRPRRAARRRVAHGDRVGDPRRRARDEPRRRRAPTSCRPAARWVARCAGCWTMAPSSSSRRLSDRGRRTRW